MSESETKIRCGNSFLHGRTMASEIEHDCRKPFNVFVYSKRQEGLAERTTESFEKLLNRVDCRVLDREAGDYEVYARRQQAYGSIS